MTLAAVATEVYESLGKDTMMNPDTTAGFARMLRWANRAQVRIGFYRLRTGHLLRYPNLRAETMWKSVAYDDEDVYAVVAADSGSVTLGEVPGTGDNRYRGWVVEVGSERRLIVASTGSVMEVNKEWDSTPVAGDAYKLYKRWYDLVEEGNAYAAENVPLSPRSRVYSVLVLEDMGQEVNLEYDDRIETNIFALKDNGDPSSFRMDGNRIYFNYNVDEERYFRMEYYRYPLEMALGTDQPDLPDVFHEAVLLETMRSAYRFKNENASAYSLKRDIDDFMHSVTLPGEMDFERQNPYTGVET